MTWDQAVNPLNNVALSALIATVPILFFFWALAIKRMKGHIAGLITVTLAILVAVIGYGMPADIALLSTGFGMLFGIFPIAWIVLTAVFLYNITVKTGQFEVIKNSIASVTDDRRLQALLIAFSFSAFLEGAAGFGTPVAIAAAMLVGLGFNPLYAAGIALVANTAPVAFGGVGIPVIVAGQVTGIDQMAISQMVGRTLPLLSIIVPFYLIIIMAGWKKTVEVWPAILVTGGSFAAAQFLTANYLNPMLPNIVASIVSIVALALFLQVWKPASTWRFADESQTEGKEELKYSAGQILKAWSPFIILTIFITAWGLKPVKEALDYFAIAKFPIPGLHEMVIGANGKPMGAVFNFNILSAAGTAILLSSFVSVLMLGMRLSEGVKLFFETVHSLRFPIITIASVLGFAYIANFSGMSIAMGVALAATGALFPFFSPLLGWLGVFITGSCTSSNALFGKLQYVTATEIGVDPVVTVAGNASGGVTGKMISPQSIAVASAAVGLVGREGDLFRFAIKHSILLALFLSVVVTLQAYVFTGLIPVYEMVQAAAATAAAPVFPTVGVTYLAVTAGVLAAVYLAVAMLNRGKN